MNLRFFAIATLFSFASIIAHAAEAIRPFETDSMARLVDSQKGKAFVLVVWSLDCEYCQVSFKNLAEEKRKRKELHIVTLATDPIADPQTAVLIKKKLETTGVKGDVWAYGDAPPEQLRYVIDPKWHGEMPRSYWFNARGERIAYSGVITAETIDKFTAR